MKMLVRAAAAAGVATFAMLGAYAGSAFAVATHIPINPDNQLIIPMNVPPPVGVPGVSFVNCGSLSSELENSFAAMDFVSGNGHEYGPSSNLGTMGGNVEGNAYWLELDPANPDPTNPLDAFVGQGHAWFGQNTNPNLNGQAVFAETFSFHGTDVSNPSETLDVQASFGGTMNAGSGNGKNIGGLEGWLHLKVTCS